MKRLICILLLASLVFGCKQDTSYQEVLKNPETFRQAVQKLSNVIVYDIFSPPVASRIYAYPNIAAYEVMAKAYPEKYRSLAGQLNGLGEPPKPTEEVDYQLAALHAFLVVSKALVFSEDKIQAFTDQQYDQLRDKGLPSDVLKRSKAYGEQVATHILDWANTDLYKQTRTYPKYTVKDEEHLWKPTPPDYMEGIEPHWREIRTMVLDSAEQYPPIPPLAIDMDVSSDFYEELIEVYEVGGNLDEEQTDIAKFWDCNPYVSHHHGHAMFATKKITPGGHWIGIAMIATRMAENTFDETVEAMALVSISLFDAFISCWDEKWRSVVVRPETLINQYLDEEWVPLLQTPPFPEYTSGHSVISRAAAVMLTDIYGEEFGFNDTTEVAYGLPAREFDSFLQASEEAAISRLYGGIHYMMAIENGVTQGGQVGSHIVGRLETRVEGNPKNSGLSH